LTVAGIILAGGLARRIGGGDKPLRLLAGRPILDHVVARIRPQLSALALNANGDPTRFEQWGLPVIADPIPDHPGPLAGILAGMDWARSSLPGMRDIVTVPGDTPFLPTDLVERLVSARNAVSADIAIAASAGRSHPVVGLWSVRLTEQLRQMLTTDGPRKVEVFVARYRVAVVAFPVDPVDPFHNINREADLTVAEVFAAGSRLSTAASARRRSS